MEAIVVMNVKGDFFSSFTIHESLKKKLAEREVKIREPNKKKLENKVEHLKCENQI